MSKPIDRVTLDLFIYRFLKDKRIHINGWVLNTNNLTGEFLWEKDLKLVYATPFWDMEDIMQIVYAEGIRYEVFKDIPTLDFYYGIVDGSFSIYKFIEWYLNTMSSILKEIDIEF